MSIILAILVGILVYASIGVAYGNFSFHRDAPKTSVLELWLLQLLCIIFGIFWPFFLACDIAIWIFQRVWKVGKFWFGCWSDIGKHIASRK